MFLLHLNFVIWVFFNVIIFGCLYFSLACLGQSLAHVSAWCVCENKRCPLTVKRWKCCLLLCGTSFFCFYVFPASMFVKCYAQRCVVCSRINCRGSASVYLSSSNGFGFSDVSQVITQSRSTPCRELLVYLAISGSDPSCHGCS